jgi:predicted nuclease of predicted toxin-antitoxin system
MGTLWSELAPIATERADTPRIYADANVPAGVVSFMRGRLHWDVLFVVEHDDLRRAHDIEHYRLARQLHRTLITMDRDYLDDRTFPPAETAGVVVLSAPDERGLRRLLERVDQDLFHDRSSTLIALPLEGAKLQIFPEFGAGQR